jgi:antitoxin CptB
MPEFSLHDRTRLRWRARRGLLENDLILTRFLDAYESQLTDADVAELTRLLELTDNDLMDFLLGRRDPEPEFATPAMQGLIQRLRAV